jgi:pimeloyl-ACP methyl ester carboxylesterase
MASEGLAATPTTLLLLNLLLLPLGLLLFIIRLLLDGMRRVIAFLSCRRPVPAGPLLSSPLSSSSSAPPLPFPPVQVVDIAGVRTELQVFEGGSGTTGAPRTIVVIFPGNPGAVDFYCTFASTLQKLSASASAAQSSSSPSPEVAVVTVGHASHSSRTATRTRFDLAQQVSHKASVVAHLLSLEPGARLVLVGHSVGAYMALEVARSLPPDALRAAVLLFPTVMHIGATVNGTKLLPLFRFGRGVAWVAAAVVALLPSFLQRRLVSAVGLPKGTDPMAVDATLSLLHPEVAYNALWMALHEMREIVALDEAHARRLQDKLKFYFAHEDGWVRPSDPATLRRVLPGAVFVECNEGHKHAFVLRPESVRRVAEVTWGWVQEAMGGGEGRGGRGTSPSVVLGAAAAERKGSGTKQRGRAGSVGKGE